MTASTTAPIPNIPLALPQHIQPPPRSHDPRRTTTPSEKARRRIQRAFVLAGFLTITHVLVPRSGAEVWRGLLRRVRCPGELVGRACFATLLGRNSNILPAIVGLQAPVRLLRLRKGFALVLRRAYDLSPSTSPSLRLPILLLWHSTPLSTARPAPHSPAIAHQISSLGSSSACKRSTMALPRVPL